MAGNVTLRASTSVFTAQREHGTAMTTPVRPDIGEWLEAMRDTMVDLLFVSVLQRLREPD